MASDAHGSAAPVHAAADALSIAGRPSAPPAIATHWHFASSAGTLAHEMSWRNAVSLHDHQAASVLLMIVEESEQTALAKTSEEALTTSRRIDCDHSPRVAG